MERAEWLLLMNIKCKLLAMVVVLPGQYRKGCFRRFCSQTFALQQSMPPPATWGVRSCPEVLAMYRKREEARGVHQRVVFARFRYIDLKEDARVAADAGPMQIQLGEEWV